MTVEQLIKELSKYDPDTIVCVTDSEGDYVETATIRLHLAEYVDVNNNKVCDDVISFRFWEGK